VSAGPTPKEIEQATKSKEDWRQFSESYPDIASAFESQLNARLAEVQSEFKKNLAPLALQQVNQMEIENSRYLQWQYSILNDRHPDYQKVVNTDDYKQWVAVQPRAVQQLTASNEASDATREGC